MTATFKENVLANATFILERKIELLAYSIDEISVSMENETKSSLGDKHETSRARMQTEQEKLGEQLSLLKSQARELKRIDLSLVHTTIAFGTLVETDKRIFFIAIALGKIVAEEQEVHVISSQSPFAQKLKGKKAGEQFEFNGMVYKILSIA